MVLRWEGCRALVKADKQERQVLVRVLGEPEKRRRLLAVIRENFDQIHAEMKEFKPTQWVALEGHPEQWLSFRELELLEQKHIQEIPIPVGNETVSVNVKQTLDGTDVPGARTRVETIGGLLQPDVFDDGPGARAETRLEEGRPLKLFISYAHEDERWRAKLAPNLGLLRREGLIDVWCDLEIVPGTNYNDEIKSKLEESELYLFLMSTDLLNSDYVQKVELPTAKRRHEENKARLVPIIVRTCGWERHVGKFEVLPKGGKPVKQWKDKDEAYFDVEEGLRRTIAEVRKMLGRS